MKITNEDLTTLTALCRRVVELNSKPDETGSQFMERLAKHLKAKNRRIVKPDTAARWEIFHAAIRQPNPFDGQRFSGMFGMLGKLYEYLNDAHIDTALRHIIKAIEA